MLETVDHRIAKKFVVWVLNLEYSANTAFKILCDVAFLFDACDYFVVYALFQNLDVVLLLFIEFISAQEIVF